MKNIIWVGEKEGQGRWALYPFRTQEGGNLVFWMNQRDYDVYAAEKTVLDTVAMLVLHEVLKDTLLAASSTYGDARAEKAQQEEIESQAEGQGSSFIR